MRPLPLVIGGAVALAAVALGRRAAASATPGLVGLTSDTRKAVERLLSDAKRLGMRPRVRSGKRSCAEQHALYAIGRMVNVDSPVVTYADGCRSWHVLGRAVDLDLDGGYDAYLKLGELWESRGGVWGGRFEGFGPGGDAGHFQWQGGHGLEELCPDPSQCED